MTQLHSLMVLNRFLRLSSYKVLNNRHFLSDVKLHIILLNHHQNSVRYNFINSYFLYLFYTTHKMNTIKTDELELSENTKSKGNMTLLETVGYDIASSFTDP